MCHVTTDCQLQLLLVYKKTPQSTFLRIHTGHVRLGRLEVHTYHFYNCVYTDDTGRSSFFYRSCENVHLDFIPYHVFLLRHCFKIPHIFNS